MVMNFSVFIGLKKSLPSLSFWKIFLLGVTKFWVDFFLQCFKNVTLLSSCLQSSEKESLLIFIFVLIYVTYLFSCTALKVLSLSLVFRTLSMGCLGCWILFCVFLFESLGVFKLLRSVVWYLSLTLENPQTCFPNIASVLFFISPFSRIPIIGMLNVC